MEVLPTIHHITPFKEISRIARTVQIWQGRFQGILQKINTNHNSEDSIIKKYTQLHIEHINQAVSGKLLYALVHGKVSQKDIMNINTISKKYLGQAFKLNDPSPNLNSKMIFHLIDCGRYTPKECLTIILHIENHIMLIESTLKET